MRKYLPLLLTILFFASGFTGLGYEVLWGRWLHSIFGASAWAVSTILAAFMAGLALGSYLGGHLRTTSKLNPFLIYGLLELGIGIYAILLPHILNFSEFIIGKYAFNLIIHYTLYNVIRFILCLLIILIPTTFMGATLPLLTEYISRKASEPIKWSGYLYGVNTLGAFIGCFSSGFFLIPNLSLAITNYVFITINLIVGLTATTFTLFYEKKNELIELSTSHSTKLEDKNAKKDIIYICIIFIFLINGIFNINYEVLWTKALNLIIGTTTYAFTVMLSIFLSGIAIGSIIISKQIDKIKNKWGAIFFIQFLISFWVIASPILINKMPFIYLKMLILFGKTWLSSLIIKIFLCSILMFPLTLLMGAIFPLGFHIAFKDRETLKEKVADLYCINTAGGIVGSFLAGFILIPLIGIELSLKTTALMHIITIAIALILASVRHKVLAFKKTYISVGAIIMIIIALVAHWDIKILASGVYFQPENFIDEKGKISLKEKMNLVHIPFHYEGVAGIVDVLETPAEYRALAINAKPVATSNFYDYRVQRLLGILPLLLHPNPENILVIGLGTGMTSGTGAIDPKSKEILIIEINKGVIKASNLFTLWNLNVLKQANVKSMIEDAMHYIKFTTKKYDIITSDPIHPFVAGSGNLYSSEHYNESIKKLKEGGIFCQWVPLYQLNEIDVKTILKTFHNSFSNGVIWATGTDFILCGAKDHYKTKLEDFYQKATSAYYKSILDLLGFWKPEEIAMAYVGRLEDLKSYFADAHINTLNEPFLEFSTPKAIFEKTIGLNLKKIYSQLDYSIPTFISTESHWIKKINYLRNCTVLLQQGFIVEQMEDYGDAIRIGKAAYDLCPNTGYVRHFAAHTITIGIDDIIQTNPVKAYNMLRLANELDPYNYEVQQKLELFEGGEGGQVLGFE
mgnify:CR=1 FL=1